MYSVFFFDNSNKKTRLEGAITFAKMGSAQAIDDLIAWYTNGSAELGIEPDKKKSADWVQWKNNLSNHLLCDLQECLEMEADRIARFDGADTNSEELSSMMERCCEYYVAAGQVEFAEMSSAEFFLRLMIRLTEDNNIYAMHYLMTRATMAAYPYARLSVPHLDTLVRGWCQLLLSTSDQPSPIMAEAAFQLYLLHDRDDIAGCIALLERAHALGCMKSMCCLVFFYWMEGSADKTLQALNYVLEKQNTPENIHAISLGMHDEICESPDILAFYIDLTLLHAPRRECFLMIEKKLKEVGEHECAAKWHAISERTKTAEDYPDIADETKKALIDVGPVKRLKL